MESHGPKRMISGIAALCLGLLLAPTTSNAQIPQTLSYQGVLADAGGTAVPDGNYNIAFKLYDVPTAGTHLWEEAQVVVVSKGIFNVVLGSLVPLALPFDKPYWLGVRVAGGAELTPRIALTSSAYSMNAMSVADNAVTSMMIVDGAVETNDLADGAVAPVKIAPGPTDGLMLTTSGGNVVWQAPSTGGPTLPYAGTVSSTSPAFSVTNTGTGPGVYGLNSSSLGVFGESIGGVGVAGRSSSGIGAGGESSTGKGVWGQSAQGPGVVGTNTTSGNYGVLGTGNYGVHAVVFSSGGTGVYAQSTSGDGVAGSSGGSRKSGVYGVSTQSDGYGVYGYNSSNLNAGYLGGQHGVYGSTNVGFAAAGVYGVSTASDGTGVWGMADIGTNAWGVHGWSTHGIGVHGGSTTGTAVYCAGKFYQSGGVFEAHPTSTNWSTNKPATVKLKDGSKVKLFAEEAAEVYFNDYGEGRLINGRAHIELDPIFLQTVTVNTLHPMKVFVQLEDDCKGVYVTNKTAVGFDVVELQGGTSSAHFSYRVVCKRKYYEGERLATDEQDIQYNERMLKTMWPEVIAEMQAEPAKLEAMDEQQRIQQERIKATAVGK